MSLARAYFETEAHQHKAKNPTAAERLGAAAISRLDVLIKAFANLAKALVTAKR
jgi:hypothetical protein